MLFIKECKRIIFSKIYILFFAAVFFFGFYSQLWSDMGMSGMNYGPPQQGGDYGMMVVDDPHLLTESATAELLNDFVNNKFTTYPHGFVHIVHLKGSDKDKLSLILQKITGFSDPESYVKEHFKVEASYSESADDIYEKYTIPELGVLNNVSIEEFRALMTETDNILGGGSDYSPEEIDYHFSLAPMPYEDALDEYNGLVNDDKVTNGYARLFCDYHGIFLALLPVFLIAVYLSADRRSRMEPLIFSRKVSSFALTFARYAALVFTIMLPVLFTAVLANVRVAQFYGGLELDYLAMFKYSIIWLLPTVIAVTGMDMLLMGFLHPIAVVVIQFMYWFLWCFCSPRTEFGMFDLVIRHNTAYGRSEFMETLPTFTSNRLFFTALGIVCAAVSVYVCKLRREGKLGGSKLRFGLPVRKSQA